jgi:hypothetical protein
MDKIRAIVLSRAGFSFIRCINVAGINQRWSMSSQQHPEICCRHLTGVLITEWWLHNANLTSVS